MGGGAGVRGMKLEVIWGLTLQPPSPQGADHHSHRATLPVGLHLGLWTVHLRRSELGADLCVHHPQLPAGRLPLPAALPAQQEGSGRIPEVGLPSCQREQVLRIHLYHVWHWPQSDPGPPGVRVWHMKAHGSGRSSSSCGRSSFVHEDHPSSLRPLLCSLHPPSLSPVCATRREWQL